MRWSAQQKISIGFAMLTLVPLALGVIAYRSAESLAEAASDVAHTNDVVQRLEHLLSLVKDVEVAQREYVLTGDERNIQTIVSLRERITEGVSEARGMTTQDYWFKLLEPLIPQKFDEIQKTIKLRRSGDVEGASQVIGADVGARAMDDIRTVFRNLIREEKDLLDRRSTRQQNSFVVTMFLFGLVLVLNLALILVVSFVSRREADRIRQLNVELERRVALRTEALQRSNEDLQQFAYIASHDLKEPLRMISSYTSLLQRRYQGKLDEDADTYVRFIVDGAARMNALIQDLLEYSRAGEVPEDALAPVDTENVVRNVLANLKVMIGESGAAVTWDKLPPVIYDPMRLTQIFQNLVANAIKYRGRRKPQIHISAEDNGPETVFAVRDNGIGIDPEKTEEIFGIFKRLHGKEYEGTGIGLAMCKKIVERHGGRIWAESIPDDGSIFRFTVLKGRAAAEATTS